MITLNGFRISFSNQSFRAYEQNAPEPEVMKAQRQQWGAEWFLHWRGGKIYGIPRVDSPSVSFGVPVEVNTADHDILHIAIARLNDVLPRSFPKYDAICQRPFSFLGKLDEIVQRVTDGWQRLPPLLNDFTINPRFELDPRIVEIHKDETEAAIVLQVSMKWQILAPLEQLQEAGIDLRGLAVVRRNPAIEERRLVGTIQSVVAGQVTLAESFDKLESIPAEQVWLEGSRTSFARCLKHLLGNRYDAFESGRDEQEARFLTGPALDGLLDRMGKFLTKASPIRLAPDLTCTIVDRITLEDSGSYQPVVVCDPVEYCFDAAKSKRNIIPWTGLLQYGPFGRDTYSRRTPRILVVCPDQSEGKVSQFMRAFRDGIQSVQPSRFPKGFAATFGLVNPEFVTCTVPLLGRSEDAVVSSYRETIENHLAASRETYDAAIVALLDQHAKLPDDRNPYLHSKATLLLNGIPTQSIRHGTLSASAESLQWTLQNFSIALYAKLGGTPWTVAHDLTVDDEIVIGMGTAELSGSRFDDRQRYVGITTVFRGDGNYLLSNVSRVCSYSDYPEVLKRSTSEVLAELKTRNGWRDGDTVRIVFHAHKPLKRIEIARIVEECVRSAAQGQSVQFAFLNVSHDHPFKIIDNTQQGVTKSGRTRGQFVPARGLVAQLGRYTRLLNINGPHQIKRPTAPLPAPLLVNLHRDSGYKDLQYLTEQILKFTSLTWRSTQPAYAPVTIYYSELIAELLARLQTVPGWSPSVLNTKLRSSRWFL